MLMPCIIAASIPQIAVLLQAGVPVVVMMALVIWDANTEKIPQA